MERHIPSTYGWRVKLDHVFPEKPRVFIFPRLSQVTKLAGMAYRYVLFTRKIRKEGKMPFIDPYAVSSCKQIYGVPLGGLGAGTIGRGWRGDFNRWQLTPGIYTYNTVYANQFTVCIRKNGRTIYQQVLAPYSPPSRSKFDRSLSAWRWEFPGGDAHYHGLYPRAWTVYNIPHLNVKLTCRQVSPVFPHNYKDTSLPVGVFIWTVENNSMENLQVSVMFTFQNGDGTPDDWAGGHSNEEFLCKGVYSEIRLLKKSPENTQNTDKNSNNNKNLNNDKSLKTDKKLTNDAPIYDANGKTRLSNINCKPSSGDNNENCKQLDDDNSITNRQDIPMDTIDKNPSSIKGDVKTSKAPSVSLDESYEVISTSDNEVSSDEDEEKIPEIELSSPHEDANCKEEVLSSQTGGCLKSTLCEKERRSFDDSHETCELHNIRGVMMHHNAIRRKFTLAIAAMHITQDSSDIVNVSTKVAFDPNSTASDIWDDLHEDGALTNKRGSGIDNHSYSGHALASAVCAKTKVKAGGQQKLQFVLVWDQPVVTFGSDSGLGYCRRYTRFFGSKGNAAPSMCCYALQNVERWEGCIDEWQTPILNDSSLPSWFKSALFNELYFMSDGGTIWLDMKRKKDCHGNVISDKVKKYGRFAYLEGHEYRMYNTYDVHFYSSWALIMLWPHLQISLQYDIGSSVLNTDTEKRLMMMEGGTAVRKLAGCVPHDLGDPEDEPFVRVNAYCIHDTSRWKDLNLHFVLQVYRDYHITKDKNFLMHMWPAMKAAMAHSMTQDTDGDGIIDNSGFADNTFDCWIVTGPSAYTGGLWLSALKCIIVIADILDLTRSISKYKNVLERGCRAFERKLWNGMYFNYDGSENEHHNSIMAGQCAGQWYLHACDLATAEDAVFRREQIRSTLKVIFQNNVMRFEGGFMGAVNGMRADGTVDRDSLQAEEVWTGVTYALAATMIQHGMVSEGFRTAEGVYRTCYEKWGLAFQTPEAITAKRTFRSRGYMRPLSIWSMYHAICARKLNQGHDDDNFKELRDNVC